MPGTVALTARDQRIRLGVEGSGMGSWDLDLRTMELTWSEAARELFGVSESVPVSYDLFLSLLEPGDRKRTNQAIREAIENGRSFDLSYPLRKPSGSTH